MALADLFAELGANLPADVAYLGPDSTELYLAPPRIAWEPDTARHVPPRRIQGASGRNEGEIWQRELSVRVRIWGGSHAETESLLVLFANLVHDQLSHFGYQLGGEVWSRGGQLSSGFEVALTVVLRLPLPRLPRPTRPLTEIDATYRLNNTAV
jgi:hypothetical protein